MKLQQLRYLCSIVDESFSITKAAVKLHTSQPGVSKQLRLLEDELQTQLLVRRNNRTTGLSRTGAAILPLARRMLKEAETMKQILMDAGDPAKGQITIATTHVHARYSLLPIFKQFRAAYPRVRVHLLLGTPVQIAYWVATGDADLAIGTAVTAGLPSLVSVPCFRLAHSLVTPPGHPLLRLRKPTLEAIAGYPLISTGPESRLSTLITERCASSGLQPDIVMHAWDIEIVKKYVELGFGIAILPTIAIDRHRDDDLRAIDASHIFEPTIASVIMQDDLPVQQYVADFVDMVAPRHRGKRQMQELPSSPTPRGRRPASRVRANA